MCLFFCRFVFSRKSHFRNSLCLEIYVVAEIFSPNPYVSESALYWKFAFFRPSYFYEFELSGNLHITDLYLSLWIFLFRRLFWTVSLCVMSDPVADFLAREHDALAGIQDDSLETGAAVLPLNNGGLDSGMLPICSVSQSVVFHVGKWFSFSIFLCFGRKKQ